jgi:hypothetical protein
MNRSGQRTVSVENVSPWFRGIVSATSPVRDRVMAELDLMSPFVADTESRTALGGIRTLADALLRKIERGIGEGSILPWSFLRLSDTAPYPPLVGCAPNVGVFPLAAAPLQWCHVLAAFAAMAALKIDHVVFIITDEDSHASAFLPAETRHAMAADVLARFSPLLQYSPLRCAKGDGRVGAFLRFLQVNRRQPMKMHLLCGCAPDVPCASLGQELSEAMRDPAYGYDSWTHPVTLVFFGATGGRKAPSKPFPIATVELPLSDALLPGLPASLAAGTGGASLASIPYSGFRHLRRHGKRGEAAGA